MSGSYLVNVSDSTQVGEARRTAVRLADSVGFSEQRQSDVAIVATEIANNLSRHAERGRLVIQHRVDGNETSLELLGIDAGPGMSNVAKCLEDGYSTAGTAGTGLGAIRRISSLFDIYSVPGKGSVVLSILRSGPGTGGTAGPYIHGAICVPAPGETVSGDVWRLAISDDRLSVMIVDGLGHGIPAHEAACQAAALFDRQSMQNPGQLLAQIHRGLSGTRGAAAAIAQVSTSSGRMHYAGIGNIAGSLIQQGESRGLMSHNGIVGSMSPRIQELEFEWPVCGLLIMHSDGLQTRWRLRDYPGLEFQHPSIIAAVLYRDFLRGRDDATVLVIRRSAGKA